MSKKLDERINRCFRVLTKVAADINNLGHEDGKYVIDVIDKYDGATCNGTLKSDDVQDIIMVFTEYRFDEYLPGDFDALCALRNYLYELENDLSSKSL